MIEARADRPRAITLGADRGYDAEDFVERASGDECQAPCRSEPDPGVADRQSMDARPATVDIAASQRHPETHRGRFRLDEDGVAGLDRQMVRGIDRVGWAFTFAAAAYNLVRLPKLLAGTR